MTPAVHAERLHAQLLTDGAPDAPAVVGHLLAVQAQDLRAARLAVRSRTSGLVAADVDRALSEDRSLVVDWLHRGTLHLVRAEDAGWLHALTTPQLRTSSTRRLAQEGVPPDDADRGVAAVLRALERDGPLPRAALREEVAAAGVRVEGQALVHVLFRASLDGHLVRGPVVEGEQAFVLRRDWLPARTPVGRDTALAELARRYLVGHGPASDRDLARWAGITLGDARRGLGALRLVDRGDGLVALGPAVDVPLPPPRLLGAFEPVLLGWVSRQAVVGPHLRLVTDNGIFRAFALVEGRAVATWGVVTSSRAAGRVRLEPLEEVAAHVLDALAAEAADVERFLRR